MSKTDQASLVIADDHVVFVDAVSPLLENHGYHVTAAHTLAETMECVDRLQPGVCLLDCHFGDDDSLGAVPDLIAVSPNTKVVVLSPGAETERVAGYLRAGASAYLHKTLGVSALIAAIDRALGGEVIVDVPQCAPTSPRPGPSPYEDPRWLASFLTQRERECLALLVDGLDTTAMAKRLYVSPATVRTHIQSLLTKLGVHSRLEAASVAVRYRLLDTRFQPAKAQPVPSYSGYSGYSASPHPRPSIALP